MSVLHALECVESNGDTVSVTDEGVTRCGPVEKFPVGDALRAWWLEQLDTGQSVILEAIALVYPREIARDELDKATGYARSTRNRLVAELSAAKLVTTRAGFVRASDRLFDRRA